MAAVDPPFRRTLPLFDHEDRDVVQRLLHHVVEDYGYDHPDRKDVRDVYHDLREGQAIRLVVAADCEDCTIALRPDRDGAGVGPILERCVGVMEDKDGEWAAIARALATWERETDYAGAQVGFEYLH